MAVLRFEPLIGFPVDCMHFLAGLRALFDGREQIAQERYEEISNESSSLWKQDVTLEQSNEVFKTLHTKLGKVNSRSLNSATEQQNSGGVLKGHVFILSYETNFERGDGMETFTLIEENGQWELARYFVNSTALK